MHHCRHRITNTTITTSHQHQHNSSVGDHVRGIYMASVSNHLLSFTYAKVHGMGDDE